MGNLSDHFNYKNFACKCGQCEEEYRVSLTLVGILEAIGSQFNKPVKIVEGFRCAEHPKIETAKTDSHHQGKACDFYILDIPLNEVFNLVQKIPEICEIGFYPEEKYVHIAVGQAERKTWITLAGKKETINPEHKEKYDLKIEEVPGREKKMVEFKMDPNGL